MKSGTLFLDEIGELPITMQADLLRVLQHGEFKRVGGNTLIKVNVRIVAATNRNLQEAIKTGRFRQDLFFRLDVLTVEMPRLSERREDIPLLAAHFMKNCGQIRTHPFPPVVGLLRRHAAFGHSHIGSSGSELASSRRQSASAHSYVGLSHFQVG